MTERARWDGSLPGFETPPIDPATGQWTAAWRPIVEMFFHRLGGDFDAGYFAGADNDTLRTQIAELAQAIELLTGQVASLREDTGLQDEARFDGIEADLKAISARLAGIDAATRAENIFEAGENQDVSFKKLTVNNTANLKGNATVAGAGFQLGFFGYGGHLQISPTFNNEGGDFSGISISNPPTQAEVEAIRDTAEILSADVRALIAAMQDYNLIG